MFETKSRIPRGGPARSWRPQAVASGVGSTPGVSRPDGGRASGLPLSRIAKMKIMSGPRTKTGIDTPRLAPAIVPTSMLELRRRAEMIPSRTPTGMAIRRA